MSPPVHRRASRASSLLDGAASGSSPRRAFRASSLLDARARALAVLLVSAPVLAVALGDALAADRLALKWSAPAGCPGAGDVKAEVDRLLGGSHVQPAKAIDVSGAVSKDDRGTWHVRLETPAGGTTRAREIHGASCRAVTDAAALVLALMIDPEAVAAAPPASGAPSVAPSSTGTDAAAPSSTGTSTAAPSSTGTDGSTTGGSTTAAPSGSAPPPQGANPSQGAAAAQGANPSQGAGTAQGANPAQGASPPPPGLPLSPGPLPLPPPPPSPTPSFKVPVSTPREAPPKLPLSFRAGVWGGADAGSLPGVSGGIGGGVALVVGRQRIELGVAIRPGTEAHLAGRPTAGGSVDLVTGSLGTCRTLLSGRLEIAPCLALEAGRMHAKGFGVSSPAEAEQPWIAASGGGLFTWWPASRFGVVARVDAVVPLARPTFVLEGVGPVHTPSPVAGRLSAGVELRF